MAPSVADPRLDVPRRVVAARGESLRNKVAVPSAQPDLVAMGKALRRALQLADMTQQELCVELGYGDNRAVIARWCAGTEPIPTAQLARLEAHPKLCVAMVHAKAVFLAEKGYRVRVKHIIEIDEVVA